MYFEAAEPKIELTSACPICRSGCGKREDSRKGAALYICPTCGKFILTYDASDYLTWLSNEDSKKNYKVSFAMRSVSERAVGKNDNSFFPFYSREDIQKLLDAKEPSVQDKTVLLLGHLGRFTTYPGEFKDFDVFYDYSIICAQNTNEINFFIDSLVELGLVRKDRAILGNESPSVVVTASGWQELNRIEQSGVESSSAFIAMSFHADRDPFEKAISTAVKAAGYSPVRVDQIEHVNRIDDEIIARIRSSKFLIADFTNQRNGVYFEAGFMLGLGRTVIWLCG